MLAMNPFFVPVCLMVAKVKKIFQIADDYPGFLRRRHKNKGQERLQVGELASGMAEDVSAGSRSQFSLDSCFFRLNNTIIRIYFCIFAAELNETLMSTQVMQKTIADYFKTQPIRRAWIFGSFARGEETLLSDVDLLVQYDENARISLLKHAAMICELEKLLDRPVDIVEDGTLRPRVRESVNQDRKLIYERER